MRVSRRSCRRRRCSRRPRASSPTSATVSRCFASSPPQSHCPRPRRRSWRSCKLCHAARVPVVARGAGTGLSGGAMPHKSGVVLSLAKFRRILAIDPLSRTAVVQPGVRNLAISEAAAPYGLYYAPDPSSQIACSIGGNVAENAGGVHCLKYGLTVHNVRRVRGDHDRGRGHRVRRRRVGLGRLRPARAAARQRGAPRRDHRDHGEAPGKAADGAGRAGGLLDASKRPAKPWPR